VRCLGVSVPHSTRCCAPFSRVRFRANRTLNRHRRMTESDPFRTSVRAGANLDSERYRLDALSTRQKRPWLRHFWENTLFRRQPK
jgi:hypothetical protein